MTLPDERTRAVVMTREFLLRLITREYKRVPAEVREEARMLIRHYPCAYEIDMAAEKAPKIFEKSKNKE
jgi:hypothetical protein